MNYMVGNTKDRVVYHDEVLLMFIGSVCTGGGPSYCLLIKHYNKTTLIFGGYFVGVICIKTKNRQKGDN